MISSHPIYLLSRQVSSMLSLSSPRLASFSIRDQRQHSVKPSSLQPCVRRPVETSILPWSTWRPCTRGAHVTAASELPEDPQPVTLFPCQFSKLRKVEFIYYKNGGPGGGRNSRRSYYKYYSYCSECSTAIVYSEHDRYSKVPRDLFFGPGAELGFAERSGSDSIEKMTDNGAVIWTAADDQHQPGSPHPRMPVSSSCPKGAF